MHARGAGRVGRGDTRAAFRSRLRRMKTNEFVDRNTGGSIHGIAISQLL